VPHEPASRRAFLAASGTALTALWLAARPEEIWASLAHAAHAARRCEPLPWESLTAEQAADIEAIAAHIFPTDETPGAREARVINFIDHALASWAAAVRDQLIKGLDELNAKVARRWPGAGRLVHLSLHRQIALLRAHDRTPFFRDLRLLTLAGMFSLPSHGSNRGKLGWKLIGFEDRFTWQPPFGDYDAEAARGGR